MNEHSKSATIITIVILVLFAGIAYWYTSFVAAPREQTTVKPGTLPQEKVLIGSIAALGANTLQLSVNENEYQVTFNEKTKFFRLTQTSNKQKIAAADLAVGAFVSVVAEGFIDASKPVYAKEIIAF